MTSRTPIGTVTCSSSKFLAIRVRRRTRPTLSCEETAICRRPMARLFNLDVERLKRFSRGAGSLPEEVWGMHNKVIDLGRPQLFYWTHGTVLGRHGIEGVWGRQWHAIYTTSLGGLFSSVYHHLKMIHQYPLWQQFQFQKFIIYMNKLACNKGTCYSIFFHSKKLNST